MKKLFKIVLLVSIAAVLISHIASCKSELYSSAEDSTSRFSIDTLKTLQSLEKVDDYPLFVMRYYGDYGFDRLLKAGVVQDADAHEKENYRCTCFAAFGNGNNPIFGRNFDWHYRASLLLFTDPPNGHAAVAMVDIHYCGYELNPDLSTLASRQGLLRAPFMPFDGMNEKGVAIGIMAVPSVQPPYDPAKKSLNDLAVVRLVLDHAESTEHAIALMRNYNIRMDEVPLHYLIADRSGKSALVEFVSNSMKVLYNSEAFQVSTNFILHQVYPHVLGNCWRYDRAYGTLKNKAGNISMPEAKELLQSVAQNHTMWSAIYNLKSGEVQIIPGRKYNTEHKFSLKMSE
jgi:hypothetical protein